MWGCRRIFCPVLRKWLESRRTAGFGLLARPFTGFLNWAAAVIYDCSDLWSKAGADRVLLGGWLFLHVKVPLINRAEQLICNCCETVFATSKYYQQKLDQRYGVQALLVENGVDFKAFEGNTSEIERPKWAGKGEASLGFVGGLKSWKLEFALPEAVFRERPQWQLILIGPVYGELNADFKALLKLPNVSWEGMVPRQDLPAYLKYFDLGLLPYLENDYNQALFPLKLYEYLACDLPVVGCGLPSTAGYAEEGLYSYSGGCPADYVAACEAALKWGNYRKERMAAAEAADWKRKFEYMLEQLKVDSA